MAEAATLQRRLERFRLDPLRLVHAIGREEQPSGRPASAALARRLADAIGGAVVESALGTVVRVEPLAESVPIDREALAGLPGQPAADMPLVFIDTETTGLATAAGTVAFLVGVGSWNHGSFRQVQLLLPDQPDEPALLEALAALIPPTAWLVTYNGRGFDWPLLVTRYRMARRSPPPYAGHLDLLPTVRRLFRHRMTDARLRTVEQDLLGDVRIGDVEGWEIPGRYLAFLRGGPASDLAVVVDHNRRDVLSLARLLGHLAASLGDPEARRQAPDGDLLGLARAFRRHGRLVEALDCLDMAAPGAAWLARSGTPDRMQRLMRDQLDAERARLLRRLGRVADAREAWRAIAGRGGPLAAIAWIELAKVLEHVDRDFTGALRATASAAALAERSAAIGRPLLRIEADLSRRRRRLYRRLASAGPRTPVPLTAATTGTAAGSAAESRLAHALAN